MLAAPTRALHLVGTTTDLHMDAVWQEFSPLTLLALPACATNGFTVLLQLVDAAFVGHIGTTELAAASMANAYFNMLWYFMLGVATALDTFASQAHGAGKPAAAVHWALTASAVLVLLCVPATAMLAAAGWVIRHAFAQSADVAALGGKFQNLFMQNFTKENHTVFAIPAIEHLGSSHRGFQQKTRGAMEAPGEA